MCRQTSSVEVIDFQCQPRMRQPVRNCKPEVSIQMGGVLPGTLASFLLLSPSLSSPFFPNYFLLSPCPQSPFLLVLMIARQASTQIHNPTLRMCGVLHPIAHGLSLYTSVCPATTPELSRCILWLTSTLVSYRMAERQESRKSLTHTASFGAVAYAPTSPHQHFADVAVWAEVSPPPLSTILSVTNTA